MSAAIRLYEHVLLRNLSAVQSIESGIRNITWFLPGRFEDSEIASEGLNTLLSLVSSYHDTLIAQRLALDPSLSLPPHPLKRANATPGSSKASATPSLTTSPVPRLHPVLPATSDHTRYTRYWSVRSGIYRRAARTLTVLSYVQLLVEMLARRKGERLRWRLVLIIESVKTFLRLILLRLTRRPVLSHPTPHRELDISSLPAEILDPPSLPDPEQALGTDAPATEPVIPLLPPGSVLRNHLYPIAGALPERYQPDPRGLIPEIQEWRGYAAEVLSSSATLAQVILLLRAARRPAHPSYRPFSLPTLSRSLPPFLVPLLFRLTARHLRRASGAPQTLLQAQHQAEQDRRLLYTFFLTGPIWLGWTRPKLQGWVDWLGKWPLIGLVGELGGGYLPLVDDYFYYTTS